MKKLYFILLTLLITGVAKMANAQITTGVISGKVTDQKGATLPGVTISVVNTSTGTRYGNQTNVDGRYTITNVNPGGPYTITASFVGFKKQELTGITINLGNATYNFQLVDENTTLKEVVVKSTGGATKTGASTRINQSQLRNMPSISRSLQDLTRLTPQSNNNSFQGTNYRYNNVTLDGAINNDAIGFSPSLGGQNNVSGQVGSSTRTSPVSLDAIQDIQVYVAPYDIKIGNVLGGSINAVTRSGTNTVTGSVYGFGRGAFLVGPNNLPANAGGDGSSQPSSFHDFNFGGRLGLPIVKDKLFFFTNEEFARRKDPVIFPAGSAGAIISQADATALTNAFKTFTGGLDPGTAGETSIYSNSNKYFNRLDWNIDDHNQLTLRNNTISSTATNLERDQQNFRFSGIDYTSHNNSSSTVLELKSRFNNSISNSFLTGYSNVHDYRDPNSNPALPQIEITTPGGTVFMGTDREASIFDMKQKTFELTDNLTWNVGKHTFTFGTHNEFYDITYNFVNAWNGRLAYSSIANFVANSPSRFRTNYNYTNNTRDYILANPSAKFKVNLLSFYAQDEFQATDNFKLTGGLRIDYAGVPTKQPLSAKTTNAVVDPNYGTTYTYTKPSNIQNKYLDNIEFNGRLSFNWDIMGDQSEVLRGGTGTFTGRVPFAWFGYAFYNNGNTYGAFDQTPAQGLNAGVNYVTPGAEGGLTAVRAQVPAFNTSATGPTQVDMIDNNFKMPQAWRSSLAFDYKTENQWRFTIEGIYTKVIHDLMFQQTNIQDVPAYYVYDTQKQQPVYTNAKTSTNFTNAYLLSNTDQGSRFSITGQVGKIWSNGLSADAAYTYGQAKDITNGIRNSMESNWQLNQALSPNSPTLAFSNFDTRHRIVANVGYRLMWGGAEKKNNTSNFQLFFNAASGTPYSFAFNGSLNGTGQQVSLVYIPKAGETVNFFRDYTPTGSATVFTAAAQAAQFDAYIDADQYLSTRRGQYTERNGARTPWNTSADFRFTQDFKVGSGKSKQTITFTYDIINLTNLLNKNWGHYYYSPNTFNSSSFIGLTRQSTTAPAQVNGLYPAMRWTNPGLPYAIDQFQSRWQMQFGVRYSF